MFEIRIANDGHTTGRARGNFGKSLALYFYLANKN